MSNQIVDPNAKAALNQMKMEIANELGIDSRGGANFTSYENGKVGGDLGGLMSKQLVKMGEEELIRQYYNK